VIILDEKNPYYDVRVKHSNVEEQVSQRGPEHPRDTGRVISICGQ
jgi:hypothetical protein